MPTAPKRFNARPPQPRHDHRPASNVRGYDARHHRWAEMVKERDGWLCVPCKAAGRLVPCRYADHKTPRHIDLSPAMCAACHARKTAADTKRYGSASATVLTLSQQLARREAQR
jgi:hypothetical protein